jgi:putative solute:sodium symporter small subunit
MRERIAPPSSFHAAIPARPVRVTRLSQRLATCTGFMRFMHWYKRVGGAVRETPISSPTSGDEQSKRFPFVALAFWALFAFVVPLFVPALNIVDVLAFPLGYFMAAQGILIAFVVIGLLSARWQDRRAAKGS